MILAFVAIAGLLLSNKDDVVSFINKHNINWFERSLESNQHINAKQPQYNGNGNKISAPMKSTSNHKLAQAPDNRAAIVSADVRPIQRMDDDVHSHDAPSKTQANHQTTVIALTNPSIGGGGDGVVTTEYAPTWKNLINKIVNSNKNDVVAVNSIRNMKKPWTTMVAQLKTTTNATPTKLNTLAPVQQESSRFFGFAFACLSNKMINCFSFVRVCVRALDI